MAYDMYRNMWSPENLKKMYLFTSEYASIADKTLKEKYGVDATAVACKAGTKVMDTGVKLLIAS
jgi:hypothetical protein